MCKNILRLHETHFRKIKVFRLLPIDAGILVLIIEFLTVNTLILLQFTFLQTWFDDLIVKEGLLDSDNMKSNKVLFNFSTIEIVNSTESGIVL